MSGFLLPPELIQFQEVLAEVLAAEGAIGNFRRRILSGELSSRFWTEEQRSLWRRVADLGAIAAPIPEKDGGLGFGALAAAVTIEEAGQSLAPLPLLETIGLALPLLLAVESENPSENSSEDTGAGSRAALLSELLNEGRRFTLAPGSVLMLQAEMDESPAQVERAESGGLTLSGIFTHVPSVPAAEVILVCGPARTSGERELYALRLSESQSGLTGLDIQPTETLDLLRSFSKIRASAAPAELVGTLSRSDLADYVDRVRLFLAAEMVGVARRVLGITSEYVKTRSQFGQPVGSFQAIQHKLADMCCNTEQAAAMTRFAAWCADNDSSQFAGAAAAAKGIASEFVPAVVEDSIQAHGGIGFTYEYELHLYLRRAVVLANWLENRNTCYRHVAQELIIGRPGGA